MPILPESPIASPEKYVDKVDSLSRESIAIVEGLEKAKRDAMDFAVKRGKNFRIPAELQTNVENFNETWAGTLQQTRDAASALAAWYKDFVKVFLPWIHQIPNDHVPVTGKVVRALTVFIEERPVATKYPLDGASGVKEVFTDLEQLLVAECEKFIHELKKVNWVGRVQWVLEPTFPGIRDGVNKIVDALESYATKLE